MDITTTAEVAELLRRPEATVRYWRHCGEGPASFRMGRRTVVYNRATVVQWLADQEKIDSRSAARHV